MSRRSVLIVAGDPSGDLHASRLALALKAREPGLEVAAVGGAHLKAAADHFLFDLASLGVSGFLEPLRRLPLFWRLRRTLKTFLARRRPAAVVCVDYYGFNRWVLQAARSAGVPAYYFVSPQVWASRPGRVKVLKRLVERMLVIFPFEEELYRKAGVPVTFVGHPLLDLLPAPSPAPPAGAAPVLGLLPGSRSGEVLRHLPVMLDAAERIAAERPGTRTLLFAAAHLPDDLYAPALKRGVELVREEDYSRRSGLTLALTSSGTATLENALLGVPMVVVYKMNWPTYAVARSLIRVPFISMPNLLAGRELAPELIQARATAERVARASLDLLADPERLAALRSDLVALRKTLGGCGAADRAARALLAALASRAPKAAAPAPAPRAAASR